MKYYDYTSWASRNNAKTMLDAPQNAFTYYVKGQGKGFTVEDNVTSLITVYKDNYPETALKNHIENVNVMIIKMQMDSEDYDKVLKNKIWVKFGWMFPKSLMNHIKLTTNITDGTIIHEALLSFFMTMEVYCSVYETYMAEFDNIKPSIIETVAEGLWSSEGEHIRSKSDDSYSTWTETYRWYQEYESEKDRYRIAAREKLECFPKNVRLNVRTIYPFTWAHHAVLAEAVYWGKMNPKGWESLPSCFNLNMSKHDMSRAISMANDKGQH
jgi:hypothetical protein